MYVVLDTNILHQEGLASRNMKRLERVCQTGKLAVCVPEMVLREFVTHKITDVRETLAKSKGLFPETRKRLPGSKLADTAEGIEKLIHDFEGELENSYKEAVENWKQQLKVEILEFNPAVIKDVFDDYFLGAGAFKTAKRREDIPDSVIGYSILPLSERGRIVNVIVKDGVLKKYLGTKGYLIFDGLTEFFESENFRKISDEIDASTKNVEELKAFLALESSRKYLYEYILQDEDGLRMIYVDSPNILGEDVLQMNAFGVQFNGTKPSEIENIKLTDVQYIEPGYFSIGLQIDVYSSVDFVASYMEYTNLESPRSEMVEMSSMNGEGLCDLSEFRKVELYGYLQVKFNANWTGKELGAHMQYLTAPNAAVSLELEVTGATLL